MFFFPAKQKHPTKISCANILSAKQNYAYKQRGQVESYFHHLFKKRSLSLTNNGGIEKQNILEKRLTGKDCLKVLHSEERLQLITVSYFSTFCFTC